MTVPTRPDAPIRCAMVSTYPPTACGLATFSEALVSGFALQGASVDVVRVVDEPQRHRPPGVSRHWLNERVHLRTGDGGHGSAALTSAVLNRYDVVVVQHEYGIYGGADGEELLALLDRLTVPVVTVLHTVLRRPTAGQLRILREVVRMSAAVVTMTRTARSRAVDIYQADPDRVHVITHGADDSLITDPGPAVGAGPDRIRPSGPVVLTWGLLGRGKGIEWAIRAMASLDDLRPAPVYLVAGRTHPRVLAHEGEAYRHELEETARGLGLADRVGFDDRYLDPAALHALVRSADVVLLPYDSVEQVTSGVLTEAVAAGKPVISTRFPHAVELLGDGAGVLVDRADPSAIADALRRVLTEPGLSATLAHRARSLAPQLSWRSVAGSYLTLCESVTVRTRGIRRSVAARDARLDRAGVA